MTPMVEARIMRRSDSMVVMVRRPERWALLIRAWLTLAAASSAGASFASERPPLGLQEAVELALSNSLAIKGAQADFEAQGAKTTASWLDLGPQLNATYNAVYFEDKITVPFGQQELVMRDKESKTGSLTLVQPLTGLFALYQKAQYEGNQTAAKQLAVADAYKKTAFSTAELYLNAQRAEKQLELAQARIEAVKSQLRDGEALLQAGRIHRGDFLKLQLLVSQAQSELARTVATADIARFSLFEATGLTSQAAVSIPPLELPTVQPAKEMPRIDDALAQALASRIEVQQATSGRESAAFGTKLAYARFSPSINLFAKYDRNFGKVGFGSEENTKSYGVQLTWQIWDNGSRFYQVSEAASQEARADAAVEEVRQRIRIDVVSALALLKAGQESFELANVANQQAVESYRIEKAKFASGKSTATELVLAESSASAATGGLLAAYTELRIQNFKLQQALGARSPQLK